MQSKKELVLNALLTNPTIRQAAESVGVSESTVYNYLKKPEFAEEFAKAKADMLRQTTGYLQTQTAETISIINDIAKDDAVNPQTRLTACRTLLEYCLKFTETCDILERIEKLEKSQNDGF